MKKVQHDWETLSEYVEDPLFDCGQISLFQFMGWAMGHISNLLKSPLEYGVEGGARKQLFKIILPMAYSVVLRLFHQRSLLLPRVEKYLEAIKHFILILSQTTPSILSAMQVNSDIIHRVNSLLGECNDFNRNDQGVIRYKLQDIRRNLKTVLDYVEEVMALDEGEDNRKWRKHIGEQTMKLFHNLGQFDT